MCQQQSDGFDACTASCPASNAAFVEDVPDYYTCGPSGSWTTLQDQDGLYPSCGRKLLQGPIVYSKTTIHLGS